MAKNKKVFLKTKDIGRLYVDTVLREVNPRVFVCSNSRKDYFLFCEIEANDSGSSWIACNIDKTTKKELINKNISVQSVYKSADENNLYAIENFDGLLTISGEYKKYLKKLPKKDIYSNYDKKQNTLLLIVQILAGIALICAVILIAIIISQNL